MKTVYVSQLDEPTLDDFINVVSNEKPNIIILLCETEWHSRELTIDLANLLNDNNIKLIVTVGAFISDYYVEQTKYFNNIEIIHWHTYWIHWAVQCSNQLDFNRTYTDFKYPYICLNNKNWIHRCMLVDELTGQGLLDKGIVTWNRFPARNPSLYQFKHYNDEVRLISDDFETKLDSFLIPDEYHQSFLHVIGEATTTVPFITEKTCLPILFKKPFVIMADQYFHQKLVNLGFELYDEIIDYSFDSEPDMLKRAEAIAVNVKRISEQNTTELYQRIKAKAERNYNNYMRIFKDINTVPEIIKDRIYAINNGLVTKQNATDGRYVHMSHLMVDRHKIIHFDIWDSQLVEKINNFINDRGQISKIIFNSAIEFEYNKAAGSITLFNELVEFAKLYNIEFHLITGTNKHNTISISDYVKIYYWPTFWLTMALNRLLVSPNYQMNNSICLDVEDVHVSRNVPIKYPFISMNKAPKVHRAIMMDMLAKHDVIDKGVVIWRETTESYPFKYWNQEIMLRDQLDRFVSQETLPLEYAMSFMQLVPETSQTLFTMSEKTAMPLFFNKPFLVAGCMGFHKQLQELGFKLYDELFDYTFDSEPDIDIRYDLIALNINRYTDKTPGQLKELYNSVFEKCVHNKKLALKLATQSSLIPTVWQDLVNHVVINKYPDYSDDINNFIRKNEHRFKEI
jgi:hypothetical protein